MADFKINRAVKADFTTDNKVEVKKPVTQETAAQTPAVSKDEPVKLAAGGDFAFEERDFMATSMALGEEGGGSQIEKPVKTQEPANPEYSATTMAVGEEGGGIKPDQPIENEIPSSPIENRITTMAVGEEGGSSFLPIEDFNPEKPVENPDEPGLPVSPIEDRITTMAVGEEGGKSFLPIDDLKPIINPGKDVTGSINEVGGDIGRNTTMALGEEGGDSPIGKISTMSLGEEGGDVTPENPQPSKPIIRPVNPVNPGQDEKELEKLTLDDLDWQYPKSDSRYPIVGASSTAQIGDYKLSHNFTAGPNNNTYYVEIDGESVAFTKEDVEKSGLSLIKFLDNLKANHNVDKKTLDNLDWKYPNDGRLGASSTAQIGDYVLSHNFTTGPNNNTYYVKIYGESVSFTREDVEKSGLTLIEFLDKLKANHNIENKTLDDLDWQYPKSDSRYPIVGASSTAQIGDYKLSHNFTAGPNNNTYYVEIDGESVAFTKADVEKSGLSLIKFLDQLKENHNIEKKTLDNLDWKYPEGDIQGASSTAKIGNYVLSHNFTTGPNNNTYYVKINGQQIAFTKEDVEKSGMSLIKFLDSLKEKNDVKNKTLDTLEWNDLTAQLGEFKITRSSNGINPSYFIEVKGHKIKFTRSEVEAIGLPLINFLKSLKYYFENI